MTLFLKLFLWFWLATALVVGAVFSVSWSTQNEPVRRQWQTGVMEMTKMQAQNAKQFYENEGQNGVEIFLGRLSRSERVAAVGFFVDGKQVAGEKLPASAQNLISKTLQSENVEYDITKTETLFAERVELKAGETGVFVLQWERPRFAPTDWRTRILQILAAFLTTGLVCYGLARYLTSPIVKLQAAAKTLSEGDFGAKIDVKRRDELGQMANEFNQMAKQIESLITSQKVLNRDISHELRTPLSRLAVALELARGKANAEALPHLERIERESARLNEMISQILTLSKLETGLQNFEAAKVNLSKIIGQVVADANFETINQPKKVEIIANDSVTVKGNERLLHSAIENVVRNALKYTKENTAVEISLKKQDNTAEIKVRDFGEGVKEEKLKDLFRPFYRADDSRERKSGGVGLGLAITERAVSAHGGRIWAENIPAGGLNVTMELPCNQAV